ncbi:MAG: FkbM family methyltransferase [Bacteroidetes bacterium]|nr:FkbM family methyltransferase [Bacteroidota bacterium]
MKKLIKNFFRLLGLEIRKSRSSVAISPPVKVNPDSMDAGMVRARDKFGIKPSTIIDLGAAEGTWTIRAEKVWPNTEFILFEPLEERKKQLEELSKKNPNIKPIFAAAGNKKGKVQFVVSTDLDGSGVYDAEITGEGREVEITTIDSEMEKHQAKCSFVLKFDTHGFELPILEGATKTLLKTDLIIMECYGFRIAQNSLLFSEMCVQMDTLGFRLADIVDIMRRPSDNLFWQCDAFFLKKTSQYFSNNNYE